MNFNDCLKILNPISIIEKSDYTVVNGQGGCLFITDKANPHLGGNLENSGAEEVHKKILWPWLIQKFSPKTLADLGCGEGNDGKWFSEQQIVVTCVEGLEKNVRSCLQKGLTCIKHDFTTGPFFLKTSVDMIWCSDVIEHIEEKFLDNIFKTFQQCKILVISHGLEDNGPTGWHHVTNKDHDWWINKIIPYGFNYLVEESMESRKMCKTGWYSLSGKIFRNNFS